MIDLLAYLPGDAAIPDAVGSAAAGNLTGTETMVCVAELGAPWQPTLDRRDAAFRGFAAAAVEAGSSIGFLPGAVLPLEGLERLDDEILVRASIAEGGRWLMARIPDRGWPLRLPQTLDRLQLRGYGLILVEPERAESVQRSPDRLRDIVGRGALILIGARSLTSDHGPRVRWTAANLLRGQLVNLLGSGGGHRDRPPVLVDGVAEVSRILRRPPEELTWFVDGGPAQVLAGGAVRPPRITRSRVTRGSE